MVKRYIAAGSSNTYSDNVSLFKFPKDPVLRQKCVKNVQRTRAQWRVVQVSTVFCAVNTLTVAALNLTRSWLHRWVCSSLEGSKMMLSLLCLRDLDLKCHTCLMLAQVAIFHEREHQAAHLWLMQVPLRR